MARIWAVRFSFWKRINGRQLPKPDACGVDDLAGLMSNLIILNLESTLVFMINPSSARLIITLSPSHWEHKPKWSDSLRGKWAYGIAGSYPVAGFAWNSAIVLPLLKWQQQFCKLQGIRPRVVKNLVPPLGGIMLR